MISLDVLVVGLTGQTGAGKSTVSKIFAENGFAIINADLISRKVVEKGTQCLDEIVDLFSEGILNEDGTLNRKTLGNIVFTDKTKLEMLNTTIYPYITSEILNEIKYYSACGKKLVLLDAPTLFESHADDFCEIIISVLADEKIREKRIIERDGLTKKQANDRMNSQLDAEYFASHSDYVIENNDALEAVNSISKEVADKIKYYYHHIRPAEMSVQ
ncbi:MAG: dephospho-CoA kinase [Ruminococcus sp.]|nr:dephospho-CoA kinase [Ruminococcus sp.]